MEINIYSFKGLVNAVKKIALFSAVLALSNQVSAQMSGNYTIDKNSAPSSANFQSYTSAVQALRGVTRSDGGPSLGGGVNGAVTITVTQGSGPYQEQVDIPSITGSSSTNRVTFDGNGELLRFSAGSTNSAVVRLNGCDYFTFKNINVKTLSSSYARGFWVYNSADYNIIEDCDIDITSSTSTSSGWSCGIALVGSATSVTSYTTGGTKGTGNIFRNNEIYGSTSNNGMYSGIALNGSSSMSTSNNLVEGNYIHNFYYAGVYAYYNLQNQVFKGNTIIRGQKSGYTTFYGIYAYYCNGAKFHDNDIADDGPSGFTYTCYGIQESSYTTSGPAVHEYFINVITLISGRYRNGIQSYAYYTTGKYFRHNTIYIRGRYANEYGVVAYEFNYGAVEMTKQYR